MRYIFRCRSKSCGQVWARDYTVPVQKRLTSPSGAFRRVANIMHRQEGDRLVRSSDDAMRPCVACGARSVIGTKVEGFTTEHVCDARCTEAKGHKCECSCGGAQHGKAWLVCDAVAA